MGGWESKMIVWAINKDPNLDESYYSLERKIVNHLEHLTRVNSYDSKFPGNLVWNNQLYFIQYLRKLTSHLNTIDEFDEKKGKQIHEHSQKK